MASAWVTMTFAAFRCRPCAKHVLVRVLSGYIYIYIYTYLCLRDLYIYINQFIDYYLNYFGINLNLVRQLDFPHTTCMNSSGINPGITHTTRVLKLLFNR